MRHIYDTSRWRTARGQAIARDRGRCTVSRLLGGTCSGPLHVHHVVAVSEGGEPYLLDNLGTSCESHHPMWESLRRVLVRRMTAGPPRCNHEHRSEEARAICERRLARRLARAA